MNDYKTYWGETHYNASQSEAVFREAARRLDFYAAAYYTCWARAFDGDGHPGERAPSSQLILEDWKPADQIAREYGETERLTALYNDPGTFVTFPGYEWHGDGSSGDHNVISLCEGLPVFRVDTVSELYECLAGRDAIAIPHHTAYRPRMRGRDWSVIDEDLSPFSELFSYHGSSETDEEHLTLRRNRHMGPAMGPGTYQSALDSGIHIGAIASTDGWSLMPARYGDGLMACLARELSRDGLWEAFKARRVYGVTGDRIGLDFRLNGRPMGSRVTAAGKRRITVKVTGSDAIDRIEILKNGRVIATHCHQGAWSQPRPGRPARFKIRVEAGWGPNPQEVAIPNHPWSGALSIEGGRMLGFEPCWISPGQGTPTLAGERAEFEMLSSPSDVASRWQNANVFEFEADPASTLRLTLNSLEEAGTVASFAAASRVMWFRDECVKMLADHAGLPAGSPGRDDVYYHVGYKAKIHRAIPEAAYTASFEFEDDEVLTSEANYRVRVEQQNGQRAWSSPVWVAPES